MLSILNVNLRLLHFCLCAIGGQTKYQERWGGRSWEWFSDFSFVCYPVMIILAPKPRFGLVLLREAAAVGTGKPCPGWEACLWLSWLATRRRCTTWKTFWVQPYMGQLLSRREWKGRTAHLGVYGLSFATVLYTFICLLADKHFLFLDLHHLPC